MRIAVPTFFLSDGLLGENHYPHLDQPAGWIDYYGTLWNRDTDTIFKKLNHFFISTEEDEPLPQNSCTALILYSLALRYFNITKNKHGEEDEYILWNYKFIKVNSSSALPTKLKPFTVLTVADKEGRIEKNVIYGPTGEAMFCIDFDSHGKSRPGSLYALTPGNLNHRDGGNPSYEPETLPWVWLAISFDEEHDEPTFKSREMMALPYEVITVDCNQNHVNPKFELSKQSPAPGDYINLSDAAEGVYIREELRIKKTTPTETQSTLSRFYGTVKSYAPYLVTLGLFYAAHKSCEKLGVYEELQNAITKRYP
jgi:hypothetical protein